VVEEEEHLEEGQEDMYVDMTSAEARGVVRGS
jgi:hypothetical protein